MFELDREVRAWTESVHADRCRRGATTAELADHLHCEIDRARAEGLTDEQAFVAAVARIGAAADLAAEHAKNRTAWGRACAIAAHLEGRHWSARERSLLLAHGILWASVVIAASLLSSKRPGSDGGEWMILLLLTTGWISSEQLLRYALRSRPRGGSR